MATILIVDDDRQLAQLIRTFLTKEGYQVRHAGSADEAYAFLKTSSADLMLLDYELPGISGLKLLEMLRQEPRTAAVPVIMMTVAGDEPHKLKGLETGADDYMVKPVSLKELAARVKTLLRRVGRSDQPSQTLEAEGIRLDTALFEAWVEGKRLPLAPAEFNLLAAFLKRRGGVLPFDALAEVLSGGAREVTSETIYVHVNNLRKKLGRKGSLIETVHGIGYKFAP